MKIIGSSAALPASPSETPREGPAPVGEPNLTAAEQTRLEEMELGIRNVMEKFKAQLNADVQGVSDQQSQTVDELRKAMEAITALRQTVEANAAKASTSSSPAAAVPGAAVDSKELTLLKAEVAGLKRMLADLAARPSPAVAGTPAPVAVPATPSVDPKEFTVLKEEVVSLKKTVIDLQTAKRSEPLPPPLQEPIVKSEVRQERPAASEGQPGQPRPAPAMLVKKQVNAVRKTASPSDEPEKKVAFITKLWDYLNGNTSEIPRHK